VAQIERQVEILRQPDTILVDASSRPEFGVLQLGRQIEIEQRTVTIGGLYHFGTGFAGPGVAITSDLNFVRMFPNQDLADVNLGLLTLKPSVDPDRVATRLREIMPADTRIFTRKEFIGHEAQHWLTSTSAGLVFGFGVIVACAVGLVILNQTLATQITRQLAQYATLKAMGYTDFDLGGIVVTLATIMSTISFVLAVVLSLIIYRVVRHATLLPIEMTAARLIGVFLTVWAMSVLSALFSLRVLRRVDPAEVF
jgi:putative ABC transport system permease protein